MTDPTLSAVLVTASASAAPDGGGNPPFNVQPGTPCESFTLVLNSAVQNWRQGGQECCDGEGKQTTEPNTLSVYTETGHAAKRQDALEAEMTASVPTSDSCPQTTTVSVIAGGKGLSSDNGVEATFFKGIPGRGETAPKQGNRTSSSLNYPGSVSEEINPDDKGRLHHSLQSFGRAETVASASPHEKVALLVGQWPQAIDGTAHHGIHKTAHAPFLRGPNRVSSREGVAVISSFPDSIRGPAVSTGKLPEATIPGRSDGTGSLNHSSDAVKTPSHMMGQPRSVTSDKASPERMLSELVPGRIPATYRSGEPMETIDVSRDAGTRKIHHAVSQSERLPAAVHDSAARTVPASQVKVPAVALSGEKSDHRTGTETHRLKPALVIPSADSATVSSAVSSKAQTRVNNSTSTTDLRTSESGSGRDQGVALFRGMRSQPLTSSTVAVSTHQSQVSTREAERVAVPEKILPAMAGGDSDQSGRAGRTRPELTTGGTTPTPDSAGKQSHKQSHEMMPEERRGTGVLDQGDNKRNEGVLPAGFEKQLSKDVRQVIRNESSTLSAQAAGRTEGMPGSAGTVETHRVLSEIKLPLETRALSNHLLSLLSSQDKNGTQRIRVVLQPPHLGSLDMEVIVRDRSVRVLFRVDNGDIGRFLHAGTDQLRGSLQGQGFSMESLTVTQREQGGSFHSDYGQGRFFSQESDHENAGDRDRKEPYRKVGFEDGMSPVRIEDTGPGRLNCFV